MPTTLFPKRYDRNQNSGPTSKVHWVPLMEVTSTLQPLHHSGIYTETEKALYHKIASLLVHLVFNFAMLSLDGKALPLMLLTMIRVWHGYGNHHGVWAVGCVGTGTVFATPTCGYTITVPMVLWVCMGTTKYGKP